MPDILYMTDSFGVSTGYEYAFGKMLRAAGIERKQVTTSSIYSLVENPLTRKGQEKVWKFNPEKLDEIRNAFEQRIRVIKPKVIVVGDPAVAGVIAKGDRAIASLEKMRGGVYDYGGIPVIVTYPITAIHRKFDDRLVENDDGDKDTYNPYRVPQGAWILQRDWEKVGRILRGRPKFRSKFEYAVTRNRGDLDAMVAWCEGAALISTDVETGLHPAQITCIGFTAIKPNGACRSFLVPFTDNFKDSGCFWDRADDHLYAWDSVYRVLNTPVPKTMHNGFYDCSYFIKYLLGCQNYVLDSMLMWYAIYMELPKRLDFVTSILSDQYQYWKDDIKGAENEKAGVGRRESSMERYWRYCALDCHNTLWNTLELLRIYGDNEGTWFNYNDVLMRNYVALSMSMRGVKADFAKLKQHRKRLEEMYIRAEERFRYLIQDPEFNINSAPDKVHLLYTIFGLPKRDDKGKPLAKNSKANPSAGKIPIRFAKQSHPLIKSYLDAMEEAMEPKHQISQVCDMKIFTDRIRTAYQAAGTESTRYSSKGSNFWDGTNLQNIRGEMRDVVRADEGCLLLDVDYSQSDDVFVSYESNDPEKIKLVLSGLDGHAVHGEMFFKTPYDDIVAGKKAGDPLIVHPITGIRQISKKVVHGTNFQMAAFTLYVQMGREAVIAAARLMGIPNAERLTEQELLRVCDILMAVYRKRYRRLNRKEWYAELAKQIADEGVLTNAFGVTRRILGDPKDNGTQREGTAFMGQSGTAGNMNRAQNEWTFGWLPERFRDGPNPDYRDRPRKMDLASHGFEQLLQTHDSFTIQLHLSNPRWKEAASNVLHVMERPLIINGHTVRVRTEAEVGLNWGKKMTSWDGKDPYDLDRIAVSLKTQKGLL